MGWSFQKIYEKETVVNISFGKVLKTENVKNYVDNPKAIDRKDKDKVSDIMLRKIKKVKWVNVDCIDCTEKYLVTVGRDGKVSKITMVGYQSQDTIDNYWERNEYDYCINTIFNSLSNLQFNIINNKGRPISEDIYIEIWFDEKKERLKIGHTNKTTANTRFCAIGA